MRSLHLLISFIFLSMLSSGCEKREHPMDNEGIGNGSENQEVQPVECDSMYYDTTIALTTTDLGIFTLDLPPGTESWYGPMYDNHTLGGTFSYGCDLFHFEYGRYARGPAVIYPNENTRYFEELELDGHPAKIIIDYHENYGEYIIEFYLGYSAPNSERNVSLSSSYQGLEYEDQILRILRTFRYK